MATVIKLEDYQTDNGAQNAQEVPYGFCQCGCGQRTTLAPQTRLDRGVRKGEPARYISGHNRWSAQRAAQHAKDSKLDRNRIERNNFQRAQQDGLRALQDYVHPHQFIVWNPGTEQDRAVQLTTFDTCTCSRFKLRDACEHIAFIQRLWEADRLPDMNTPVSALEVL